MIKLEIVKSYITNNPYYKRNQKMKVKGLVLHSVGCPQPSAQVFIKNWNTATYTRACIHGFIDANTGTIYQTMPFDRWAPHAGRGKKGRIDNDHLGFEMCETKYIKYTGGASFTCSNKSKAQADTKRTYDAAVELFAKLCDDYNLDPLQNGVIVSHSEASKMGMASNHADPEHLWKGLGMPYSMQGFREDVDALMRENDIPEGMPTVITLPARVRVSIDNLNIRRQPSVKSPKVGVTKKGIFTIVEILPGPGSTIGWGLLKSHAENMDGWISLDYATIL